jgi:hypothetical protein
VRFLTEHALLEPQFAPDNVGERLGQWLDFRQAIPLHALLQSGEPPATPAPTRAVADAATVRAHVDKTRALLSESILRAAPVPGTPRIPLPTNAPERPLKLAQAWEPYRRYASTHQRQMESCIETLRTQVRATVAHGGAALHHLALLDAAYEQALREREARLLASLPAKLEVRFMQLAGSAPAEAAPPETSPAASAHRQAPTAAPKPDWLMQFEDELQQALLAELDLRLQPVLGLVDAYQAKHP